MHRTDSGTGYAGEWRVVAKKSLPVLGLALLLVLAASTAWAQTTVPFFRLDLEPGTVEPEGMAVALQLFLLFTVLSLAPSILIMMTSFTRIIIVLTLLRQAMGTNQMPPRQVVLGLALFLTVFIMMPVWQVMHEDALKPYIEKTISQETALELAAAPLRKFMIKHTREKDLALFVDIAQIERPRSIDDVPTYLLIPAFIISEVKTAFQIGLLLYVPFMVIDMVVASILLSMGMMMLPPVLISMPFKLMLFVLTDAWYLIIGSLVKSFL